MNEAELRMQAGIAALVAETYAVTARIEGCKAANQERVAADLALAYPETVFEELACQLDCIAVSLRMM